MAVRGGGHSFPGLSLCEGGIVIDLGPMKGVRLRHFDCRGTAGLPRGSRDAFGELNLLWQAMAAIPDKPASACAYVVADDGLARWSDTHADAWIGMLETHKSLTRALEAELEAEHGLSLSGLELMGRLAASEKRMLRLSTLAEQTGLSLSRVSRITDMLEARGLVERRLCPSDARARNAWLTDQGLELLRAGQASHFAGVQRRFFDKMEPEQVEALSAIFARFAPDAADACSRRARQG